MCDLSGKEQGGITHNSYLKQKHPDPNTTSPFPSLWLLIKQEEMKKTVSLGTVQTRKKQSKWKSDNNSLLQRQNLPEVSRQKEGILAPRKDAAKMRLESESTGRA